MSTQQFTPHLQAAGDIAPYRLISIGTGADNTAVGCAAGGLAVAVSDQSTKREDSTLHAESGDVVNVQPGHVWLCEANAAITRGAQVAAAGSGASLGRVATATTGNLFGVALESAADAGSIIRVLYRPQNISA
jgi:hypothetical protein